MNKDTKDTTDTKDQTPQEADAQKDEKKEADAPSDEGKEVGFVVKAQDYLFHLEGLPTARVNDVIVNERGSRALVTGLAKERLEAMLLDPEHPRPGDMYTKSKEGLRLNMGNHLLGRAINPLGKGLDDGENIGGTGEIVELDVVAPGIEAREVIDEQMETGITVIDTLMPLGKGQRELIFGEPRSGKTTLVQDIIANQKGRDVVCVYVAIGKEEIEVKRFVKAIEDRGAREYTVIVAATSAEAAPVVSIAPDMGLSVAESFRNQGRDVFVFLDDLGTHAKYMREIALLSDRVPGRESYPGDIFYVHAHNLERAGHFNDKAGNGTITMMPIIETDLEKFTALIPTNVMASTDGHLLLDASFRAEGRYPSIDPDRSVTRVGAQTQKLLHKIVSDKVKALLVEYAELRRFSRFGAEVSGDTQVKIKRGQIAIEMLKQESGVVLSVVQQIMMLGLLFTTFFDEKPPDFVEKLKAAIVNTLSHNDAFKAAGGEIESQMDTLSFDDLIKKLEGLLPIINQACQS